MAARLPAPGRMTARQLQGLASAGETDHVEFKGRRASLQDIASAVVCFANAEGGIVLYGIGDDGTLEGTGIRTADAVSRHVYHSTSPSQVVTTQLVAIEERNFVAVWVEHSPVLISTSAGGYVQRLGTECVPMTPDRLIVRQIDTRALDLSSAITPVPITAASELQIQRYRELLPADSTGDGLRALTTPALLRTIGAAAFENPDFLTVAGLLVFAPSEVIKDVLPAHQVLYLRTPSGTTEYERRLVSSAPLFEVVDVLVREIQAASRVRSLRLGMRDLEIPDYPERVLREALVNALAHRHYTLPGDTVIRQTSGLLEIENPGGFPEGISVDTVIQHAPVHRNRLLCEILDRVRYMERSGLGVDRIFGDEIRYGKLPPTYHADRTSVRLRLDASEFDEQFARFVLAEELDGREWRVEDLLIASHLRRMGPTDRSALAGVIQRPEDETQEIISSLMPQLLERFGTGPGTRFALNARVQAALGSEAAFTRERGLAREYQRSLVVQHAREFTRIDNKTVREILQVSPTEATNILRSLASRGDLIQRGTRRGAY